MLSKHTYPLLARVNDGRLPSLDWVNEDRLPSLLKESCVPSLTHEKSGKGDEKNEKMKYIGHMNIKQKI